MKKLFVPKGIFTANEGAVESKRKEIAKRLRKGEVVNLSVFDRKIHTDDLQSETVKIINAPEGKLATDSFLCSKCGCRMILKVLGNRTHCRAEGCNGTMYRVQG